MRAFGTRPRQITLAFGQARIREHVLGEPSSAFRCAEGTFPRAKSAGEGGSPSFAHPWRKKVVSRGLENRIAGIISS
jgi:hypothetical protein